jgi:hypothetical protein
MVTTVRVVSGDGPAAADSIPDGSRAHLYDRRIAAKGFAAGAFGDSADSPKAPDFLDFARFSGKTGSDIFASRAPGAMLNA